MVYLSVGDRLSLTFDETEPACDPVTATVVRTLSDREEGLSPEADDYVACWIEIRCDGDTLPKICTLVFRMDDSYTLDGQSVTIQKIGVDRP